MTFDDLKARSQSQLDDLFKRSPAGPIPEGDAAGEAVVCPGTWWSRLIARFVHALVDGVQVEHREEELREPQVVGGETGVGAALRRVVVDNVPVV